MRREELAALGDLASSAAAGTAGQIYEMHRGIADRVWRAVGPAALPVRVAHDRIARGAYSVAREVTRSVVRAGANAVSASHSTSAASIEVTLMGRTVVGALNGVWGDTLARSGNELALGMTARQGGRDVPLTTAGLRAAYPYATGRLALFVHGL